MVAVLELIQRGGGFFACWIALPNTRVESTRESRMAFLFFSLYRQSTLLPAKLMRRVAPSRTSVQFPRVFPSQWRTVAFFPCPDTPRLKTETVQKLAETFGFW